MTTGADVAKLRAARDLVARPGGWTRGYYFRDARGIECEGNRAQRCCAEGALFLVEADVPEFEAVQRAARCHHLPTWNDEPERTQVQVVAVFDFAIAAEERPS